MERAALARPVLHNAPAFAWGALANSRHATGMSFRPLPFPSQTTASGAHADLRLTTAHEPGVAVVGRYW